MTFILKQIVLDKVSPIINAGSTTNALSLSSIQKWHYVIGPHKTHIGIRDNETSPQK